jgi:hypothetical protein
MRPFQNRPNSGVPRTLATWNCCAPLISAIPSPGTRLKVFVVDFTDAAQTSHTSADYTRKIAAMPADELRCLGLALYGKRETISKLTGSLPLLK